MIGVNNSSKNASSISRENCVRKTGSMVAANKHAPIITEVVPTMGLTSIPQTQYIPRIANLSIPFVGYSGKTCKLQ